MRPGPVELPGSRDGRLVVTAAPGSLTLTRATHNFGTAKTVLIACVALGLCFGFMNLFVPGTPFGVLSLVVMLILGLIAAAAYAAALRPSAIIITINAEGITRTERRAPARSHRPPAVFTLTPLVGSRAHYRGETDGPAAWQWLLHIGSLYDGHVDQFLIGTQERRSIIEAAQGLGPQIVLPIAEEQTPMPWVTACPQCGYDLIGIGQPRCPECGLPISSDNFRHLQALAQERRGPAR